MTSVLNTRACVTNECAELRKSIALWISRRVDSDVWVIAAILACAFICFFGYWAYRPVAGTIAFASMFSAAWVCALCVGGADIGLGPRLATAILCGLVSLVLVLWLIRISFAIIGALAGVELAAVVVSAAHITAAREVVGVLTVCGLGLGIVAYVAHAHVAAAFLALLGAFGMVSTLDHFLGTGLHLENAFTGGSVVCRTDACAYLLITFFAMTLAGWAFQIFFAAAILRKPSQLYRKARVGVSPCEHTVVHVEECEPKSRRRCSRKKTFR